VVVVANIQNYKDKELSAAIASWIDTTDWANMTAVTLTMKKGSVIDDVWVPVDELRCRKALKHYVHRVNRAVYKNDYRKKKKRCRVVAAVECDADGRWHVHAAIEGPAEMGAFQFEFCLRTQWRKIFGSDKFWVKRNADLGWIKYMFKHRQKGMFDQDIDGLDLGSYSNH